MKHIEPIQWVAIELLVLVSTLTHLATAQSPDATWRVNLNTDGRWYVPAERFYRDFKAGLGYGLAIRLHEVGRFNRTEGLFLGFSYQRGSLKYENTSSVFVPSGNYGYDLIIVNRGSITCSQIALELGRAFPFDSKGSHGYLLLGIVSINNEGGAPSSSGSLLGYQSGSQVGIRLKVGIGVLIVGKFGLSTDVGVDAMRARITYTYLNNYSELKHYGVLLQFGFGIFYQLAEF